MRKLLFFLLIFCFTFHKSDCHGLIGASGMKKSDGGSGSFYDDLCHKLSPHIITMTITPDKFPFKVTDITLTNESQNGMNIYFSGFMSMKIITGRVLQNRTWQYTFAPNQVVYQNSSLLNNDGNLKVYVEYKAFFCIGLVPPNSAPFQNFLIEAEVEIENYNPINGNSTGFENNSIVIDTGWRENENGSLPYRFAPSSYPGPWGTRSVSIYQGEASQKSGFHQLNGFRFSAYPNPVKNSVLIDVNIQECTNLQIKILDTIGNLVFNENRRKLFDKGQHKLKIDLSMVPNGLYIVQLVTNNGILSKKIRKE